MHLQSRTLFGPKLHGDLLAGHRRPDNQHEQLRYEERGDKGDDPETPSEETSIAAEVPLAKRKDDSQSREREEDDRVQSVAQAAKTTVATCMTNANAVIRQEWFSGRAFFRSI